MNNVSLIGRLVKDVEVKVTNTGKKVCSFNLAIGRRGSEGADFPILVAWNQTAELLSKYTKKGDKIGVIGRIQTRTSEDNNRKKYYHTEVIVNEVMFLEPKQKQEQQPDHNQYQYGSYADEQPYPGFNMYDDDVNF